jgi:hypothetical protein
MNIIQSLVKNLAKNRPNSTGIGIDFSSMSVEDAVMMMYLLVSSDARRDVKEMLEEMDATRLKRRALREAAKNRKNEGNGEVKDLGAKPVFTSAVQDINANIDRLKNSEAVYRRAAEADRKNRKWVLPILSAVIGLIVITAVFVKYALIVPTVPPIVTVMSVPAVSDAPRDVACATFGCPQALESAPTDTIIQLEEPQLQLPDLSPTATPEACIWQAMLNVYFRKGPDVGLYDKIDAVEKGTTLPIVGQSEDGVFWVVQIHPDLNGYVTKSEKYSLTTGDCSKVLTLKDPEPPVIKSVPQNQPGGGGTVDCSSYVTDSACNAASGCSYDYGAKACK